MKLIIMTAALAMGAPAFAQAQNTPQSPQAETAQTLGGLEPDHPPMAMQPQPGQEVVFVPSEPVSEAFPPPPPQANYPVCKKGQYNACRQRGN